VLHVPRLAPLKCAAPGCHPPRHPTEEYDGRLRHRLRHVDPGSGQRDTGGRLHGRSMTVGATVLFRSRRAGGSASGCSDRHLSVPEAQQLLSQLFLGLNFLGALLVWAAGGAWPGGPPMAAGGSISAASLPSGSDPIYAHQARKRRRSASKSAALALASGPGLSFSGLRIGTRVGGGWYWAGLESCSGPDEAIRAAARLAGDRGNIDDRRLPGHSSRTDRRLFLSPHSRPAFVLLAVDHACSCAANRR